MGDDVENILLRLVQAADYDIYAVAAPQFASYAVYASPWADDATE